MKNIQKVGLYKRFEDLDMNLCINFWIKLKVFVGCFLVGTCLSYNLQVELNKEIYETQTERLSMEYKDIELKTEHKGMRTTWGMSHYIDNSSVTQGSNPPSPPILYV